VNEVRKVAAKVHGKCNKLVGCRLVQQMFTKVELGRESGEGEVVAVAVKY